MNLRLPNPSLSENLRSWWERAEPVLERRADEKYSGARPPALPADMPNAFGPWSPGDDGHLMAFYGARSNRQLARELGRSIEAVTARLWRLGLKRGRR